MSTKVQKMSKQGKVTIAKKAKPSLLDKIQAKIDNYEAEAKVYVEELAKANSYGFTLTVGLLEDAIKGAQADIEKQKAALESAKGNVAAVSE
jgi:hypothetical protein